MIKRSPIRLAFYDDRIEIDNPGWLLPGLTVDMMREGSSRVRNPLIARAFHEVGLIEAWGTGIPGVMANAVERGLPEPTIVELPGIIRVIVPTHHQLFMAGKPPYPSRSEAMNFVQPNDSGDQVRGPSGQVGDQVSVAENQVDARVITLLETAVAAPASRADLLTAIGMSNKHVRFARWVQPLIDAGWLQMTQPDSPRSPTQRYQITDVGRQVLDKNVP